MPTGIIIPLYTSPGDTSWTDLANAAHSYPNVEFLPIANPSNGTPSAVNGTTWSDAMLAISGPHPNVKWLGYTDTAGPPLDNWHSWTQIQGVVNTYLGWTSSTGVNPFYGFFFDDFDGVNVSLAQSISSYLHPTTGKQYFAVGNPGATLPTTQYIGLLDCWCILENCNADPSNPTTGISASTITAQGNGLPASQMCYIIYGVPSWSSSMTTYVQNTASTVAFLNIGANPPGVFACPNGGPYDFSNAATYASDMAQALSPVAQPRQTTLTVSARTSNVL